MSPTFIPGGGDSTGKCFLTGSAATIGIFVLYSSLIFMRGTAFDFCLGLICNVDGSELYRPGASDGGVILSEHSLIENDESAWSK